MAIRIVHQPSAVSLAVPYAAGRGRAKQRQNKYMLDMFQRDRYQQNRLAALGGGRRRAVANEPQGRWLENQDVVSAAATVQAGRQWRRDGQPLVGSDREEVLAARKTLRQRKAQERRAARRGRLGIESCPGSRFQGDLLPQYQSAEEQAALAQQAEWDREDMIREEGRKHDFAKMDALGDRQAIQGLAEAITADPQEGGPVYSPEQQAQAQLILGNPKLSPEEQYEKLEEILNAPAGTPETTFTDKWKANTTAWDWATNQPVPEGTPGAFRMPLDEDGNPNVPLAKELWELQQSMMNPPSEQEAKEEAEAAQKEIDTLGEAETAAEIKVAEAEAKKAALDPSNKAALTAQQKVIAAHQKALDAIAKKRGDLLMKQMGIDPDNPAKQQGRIEDDPNVNAGIFKWTEPTGPGWQGRIEDNPNVDASLPDPNRSAGPGPQMQLLQSAFPGNLPEGARMLPNGEVEYNGRRYRRGTQ